MRRNKVEFCIRKEATPGTYLAPGSSHVLARLRRPSTLEVDYEVIDLQEMQSTSSQRPNLVGRRSMGVNAEFVLRGSGAIATVPAIGPFLEAAMMKQEVVKQISIGSVTGGPFKDGVW